jgi:hypothetical protein
MTTDDLDNLKFGDVVKSKSDGEEYVITQPMHEDGPAVGVSTVMIGPQNLHDFTKLEHSMGKASGKP